MEYNLYKVLGNATFLYKKKLKLHGLSLWANYTDRATERPPPVGEVIANFCG
jgi:hypothetical protein